MDRCRVFPDFRGSRTLDDFTAQYSEASGIRVGAAFCLRYISSSSFDIAVNFWLHGGLSIFSPEVDGHTLAVWRGISRSSILLTARRMGAMGLSRISVHERIDLSAYVVAAEHRGTGESQSAR